jgi:uncharacterized protein (UPF0264 family)
MTDSDWTGILRGPADGIRLLVSVRDGIEASAALSGGADLIDAKDPSSGALGAVTEDTLHDIALVVGRRRPLSAALGDAAEPEAIERLACVYAAAGAALVKIGFAGVASAGRVATLIASAVRGARAGSDGRSGVVAVAYADADTSVSLAPTVLLDVAARAGASAVLLDTADKNGLGLPSLVPPAMLSSWAAAAHETGMFVALSGRLTAADLPMVRRTGADIAGVRGAACDDGRNGRVTAIRVRNLLAACAPDPTPFDNQPLTTWETIEKRRADR